MLILLVAFATSALVCHLIVRSARWHLPYTADEPGAQIQKFHTEPVPRVGGLGILAGIAVAGVALEFPQLESELYWLLVLSLLPAFFGGFAEDVTGRVGPAIRLLATVITAACAYSLVGVKFVRSHVEWLDLAIAFAPLGYAMLLFAVAGVAHSINIVDGYNGLASGVVVIALAAMGYVAHDYGDTLVATFCAIAAAATAGFLILNYPRGKLFLGDGGAYVLGAIVALMAAMLVQRNDDLSPWFPLVLVTYPVWETLFSVLRRVLVYGTRIGEPDARHLHSLVYRRRSRRWARALGYNTQTTRNALTTLPFWALNLGLAALAVTFADAGSTRILQLVVLVFLLGYSLVYWRLARLPGKGALKERLRQRARRPVAAESGSEVGK